MVRSVIQMVPSTTSGWTTREEEVLAEEEELGRDGDPAVAGRWRGWQVSEHRRVTAVAVCIGQGRWR